MASSPAPRPIPTALFDDLLVRETNHRCTNDLQLVVSLLALQSRRALSDEARQALTDAMERVAVLARARASLLSQRAPTLAAALRQVCEALQSQAEPRAILLSLEAGPEPDHLTPVQITALALIVNELATNAIKHAFAHHQGGRIQVSAHRPEGGELVIAVDDDGIPFPPVADRTASGLGLGIIQRLLESVGGLIVLPANGSKRFEIRMSHV